MGARRLSSGDHLYPSKYGSGPRDARGCDEEWNAFARSEDYGAGVDAIVGRISRSSAEEERRRSIGYSRDSGVLRDAFSSWSSPFLSVPSFRHRQYQKRSQNPQPNRKNRAVRMGNPALSNP